MKKNMKYLQSKDKGITLVAMVITVIVLLLLAGIAIATLGGENGIFEKVKQAKKAQIESEMKEQLTMVLQELQIEKQGNATLDDVTQDWANKIISTEYNPQLKEDASYNGKLMIMTKDKITGKFMIDQNLNITSIEYNTGSVEVEYTTISRTDNKVRINIVVTDNINGIKQIDYPEGNPLKVVSGVEKKISIDYDVELGVEYKFVITSGDGSKTEKIIKIDDYFYNVTKTIGDGATIDNNATKVAYNKTYEATISTTGNYVVTSLNVTMDGQSVTTSGNDVVDINTGKIKIEKVTGDIDIKVATKELKIQYTADAVSTSNSASNTNSLGANTQNKGTTLYINIIAILEGNNCSVLLKSDNSKTVPYAVTSNGKYTFIVRGTYNGKSIEEEKEVIVNQYMSAKNVVQYDAGDWTQTEIQELQNQNLYMINKDKKVNSTFNLNDKNTGLNYTFGGFTYEGDTVNASDITSGNIITSRNKSVSIYQRDSNSYTGWQILEIKDKDGNKINNEEKINQKIKNLNNEKIYVTKIVHAGSPENFVCDAGKDSYRTEYLLSGGKRQTDYNTLDNGKVINPRSWQMYIDQNQKDLIADTTDKDGNQIKDIHAMDYSEAYSITNDTDSTDGIRKIGETYCLPYTNKNIWYGDIELYIVYDNGSMFTSSGLYIRRNSPCSNNDRRSIYQKWNWNRIRPLYIRKR